MQHLPAAGAEGVPQPGEFLADFRVGSGGRVEVRRGLIVAVPRPACEHGLGAFLGLDARADGDDVDGERPRQERGPERGVGHAPGAQLAIGGLARIDVHKRHRFLVDRDRQFEGAVPRDLRLPERAVHRRCGRRRLRRPLR